MESRNIVHGPEPFQPLSPESLGSNLYNALKSHPPDRIALIDVLTNGRITYQQLLHKSIRLAEALRRLNFNQKTVVALSGENNIYFHIPSIACSFVGTILTMFNPVYSAEELKHANSISRPMLMFCTKLVAKKFVSLKKELKYDKVVVIDADSYIEGAENLEEFIRNSLRGTEVSLEAFRPHQGDPKKIKSYIFYSSGTTGLPKGVLLSQQNILVRFNILKDPRYTVITENDNILGLMPFFHAYGFIGTLGALFSGRKVIVLSRFDEDLFLRSIQDYRITNLWLAPPLMVFLAKSPKVLKYDLSHVNEILCGAAPLSKNIEEEVLKRFKINSIKQGYGLTEMTLAVTLFQLHDHKQGSVGKIVPFIKAKVRDPETGTALGPNQVGELCFKGPMTMMGYYGDIKATRDTFTRDGWLKTGDLGYYDQEGYFYIVDRLKELIKYKGFQVPPAELEAILLSHPKVKDVGVVGLPDELAGELPLAFVVKNPNTNLTEQELIDFVSNRVSAQKKLRGGVVFLEAIPKNPSGKILRRELRKLVQTLKPKSKL